MTSSRPHRTLRAAVHALVLPCTLALAFAASAAQAKSLVVCTEASPDGFDVVQFNSVVTTNASADVIFNGLVAFDDADNKVVPALADKWDVSADGLHYTFHLRPNVQFQKTAYFSPTRALDADDVIFTFARMLDANNPWHKVSGPSGFPHALSMQLPKLIKSIDKVDAQTVRFTLSAPNATFLSILTMGFASIYPAEYADQLLKANRTGELNTKPIGTGPFVLHDYQKDAVIRYDVNPAYWGAKPKIDKLIYAITPDTAVRLQKLKAGECQIALAPKTAGRDRRARRQESEDQRTPGVHDRVRRDQYAAQALRQSESPAGPQPRLRRPTYVKAVFDGMAHPRSILSRRVPGATRRTCSPMRTTPRRRRSCWPRRATRTASRRRSGRGRRAAC